MTLRRIVGMLDLISVILRREYSPIVLPMSVSTLVVMTVALRLVSWQCSPNDRSIITPRYLASFLYGMRCPCMMIGCSGISL